MAIKGPRGLFDQDCFFGIMWLEHCFWKCILCAAYSPIPGMPVKCWDLWAQPAGTKWSCIRSQHFKWASSVLCLHSIIWTLLHWFRFSCLLNPQMTFVPFHFCLWIISGITSQGQTFRNASSQPNSTWNWNTHSVEKWKENWTGNPNLCLHCPYNNIWTITHVVIYGHRK